MGSLVERSELGGLPLLWVEAPPPFTATLEFRVGQADEHLAIRGITHLVEHLAIFSAGIVRHDHNGAVGVTQTGFWASGTPEQALGFIDACVRGLTTIPFDRLAGEKRVLRTEAGAPAVGSRLLNYRFGASGLGLVNYEEMGLRWLTPEHITRWSEKWFTRGNAVLTLSGPPPEGIGLAALPAGARMPDPVFDPVPPGFPVHVSHGTGGVAIAFYAPRSTALNAAAAILTDRLRERLRFEAALSYAPWSDYGRMDVDMVHLILGTDCEDQHARQVQDMLWRTVDDFADAGPTEEELALHLDRVHEWVADPQSPRGELGAAADLVMRGRPPEAAGKWIAELEAMPAGDMATAMRAALEGAILLAPAGVGAPTAGFGPAREPSAPLAGGDEFRPKRTGLVKRSKERVRVSPDGLAYSDGDGETVNLHRDQLVLGVSLPTGAFELHTRGGAWVSLDPRSWDDGEQLLASMRSLVGADRVVPCGPAETAETVQRLAGRTGADRVPALADALVEATWLIHDQETAVLACSAGTGGLTRDGLLVLTTERVLWLPIDAKQARSEHLLSDVRDVRSRSVSGVRLVLDTGEVDYEMPPSWRGPTVDAIRERLKAVADRS